MFKILTPRICECDHIWKGGFVDVLCSHNSKWHHPGVRAGSQLTSRCLYKTQKKDHEKMEEEFEVTQEP